MSFVLNASEKAQRKAEINQFVAKHGRGDRGLNSVHKKNRVEKFLGVEMEKVKGYGTDLNEGVVFFKHENRRPFVPDQPGLYDRLPDVVLDDLMSFPDDPTEVVRTGTSKVLDVDVRDDGSIVVSGIKLDGNERDLKLRCTWGVRVDNDVKSARSERKQHQAGKLKEVSDRTMAIHDDEGYLDVLFDDSDVDTGPDKAGQV